ncbi:MAG: hypothetical protein HC886_14055 [Leptolyngbyaceae cyanobacterium SM1_1_3]|nr:hypothetical protein [Leptolyngbyaceae cyanobacterium SM1_1_3]NJN04488.1 hypothetical protein [Leptolyngbyaceae cyanobacterium RM1_1_2]NJO10669.1 hypothetical protein [Leptolyngbyaceae cyanobacterium SL_1_1]
MKVWQLGGLGVFLAGAIAIGCTGAASTAERQLSLSSKSLEDSLVLAENALVESSAATESFNLTARTGPVDFSVCYESAEWQRPETAVQLKQLEEMPRYGSDLYEEPLQSLFQKFWTHKAFTFTTYGLSARMEPIYFSGLWTVLDDVWNCYDDTTGESLNAGQVAELWLIDHQVESIEWTGDRYQVVVQPADSGIQFVQFPRRDTEADLPIAVVTSGGTSLSVASGDW